MDFDKITSQFFEHTANPESFLRHNTTKSDDLKHLLKSIYAASRQSQSKRNAFNALPELLLENCDTEQIWQQIEVQNNVFFSYIATHITKIIHDNDGVPLNDNKNGEFGSRDRSNTDHSDNDSQFDDKVNKTNAFDNSDSSDSDKDINIESESDSNESSPEIRDDNDDDKSKTANTTEVDDKFFNLQEMESFLDNEDKKEVLSNVQGKGIESDDSDDEVITKEIDFFTAISDEDEMKEDNEKEVFRNPRYKDFFIKTDGVANANQKRTKRNKYLNELEQEEEFGDLEENIKSKNKEYDERRQLSTFDQRQERLNKKISILENLAVSAKSWQLKGEITADSRPENSLLENVLEFDMSTRPAPVITEETTMRLEDIIRQRIKDRVWDSVQKKKKPSEDVGEYKKQLVMDGEKSKMSLAQIYEKDYLKQTETNNHDEEDKDNEENLAHKEIHTIMTSLVIKLDALCNYHYTPKHVTAELRVVTNLPAISMEEVAPLASNDAALLAPEEVHRRNKGKVPQGLIERTDTDKKRQRRAKKSKQKMHAMCKRTNIPENKYTKEKAKRLLEQIVKDKNVDKMKDSGDKTVKSSTVFFEQLQDQVKSTIEGKVAAKKRKSKMSCLQANKLKL